MVRNKWVFLVLVMLFSLIMLVGPLTPSMPWVFNREARPTALIGGDTEPLTCEIPDPPPWLVAISR